MQSRLPIGDRRQFFSTAKRLKYLSMVLVDPPKGLPLQQIVKLARLIDSRIEHAP
jgi:hypothetical protein